jgi:hypothetical protein
MDYSQNNMSGKARLAAEDSVDCGEDYNPKCQKFKR